MAAPESITIDDLTGRWSMNLKLSDSYDSILKIQGVNWLTRKVLNVGSITMTIKQHIDEAGLTHLTIDSKSGSGLPGSTENRLLNNETRHANHPLFGKITGRTAWVNLADLPSTWLADGWEQGTTRAILMTTEHLDVDGVTYQAGGFEQLHGEHRYVRHIEVRKGDETLKAKLVYDYLGPLEE
ncbi:unnamed protein product [Penicillium glandicola]